jgi:hypothetical protein
MGESNSAGSGGLNSPCSDKQQWGRCTKEHVVDWRKLGLLVGLCGLVAAGCRGRQLEDTKAYGRLGPAQGIVSTSLQWMGGYEAWRTMKPVEAEAVVTVYAASGPWYVNRQAQVIDLADGELEATARTGEGTWRASARVGGRCRLKTDGPRPAPEMVRRTCGALQTLAHRVRGPLNLLGGDETVLSVGKTRLAGEDLVRVAVQIEDGRADGYYFNGTTGELRYVTAGVDEPGRKGTITTYTYTMLPNGLIFPRHIRVMEIGDNALLSRRPILDVEYTEVRIR